MSNDGEREQKAQYIHSYSREQALEDGVLVDISEAAALVGFKFPTAFTAGCGEAILAHGPNPGEWDESTGERLMALLNAAKWACRESGGGDQVTFVMDVAPLHPGRRSSHLVEFLVTITPGDTPEPVITIMLPEER